MLPPPIRIPRATYRLQFTPTFGFEQARKLVPYLAELGISELYASPFCQASSDSTHGYDVNNYNRISPALGGREELDRLSTYLRQNGMGLLIDFVPNHMGIDGESNLWWSDVLENGTHSRFASFFDIEWHPRLERLNDRVLVPMLGSHYGAVLESGKLSLGHERGRFVVRYGRLKLPIRPGSYGLILQHVIELLPSGDGRRSRLREWVEAFESLPVHQPEERESRLHELRHGFAKFLADDHTLQKLLGDVLHTFNGIPGNASSFELLHQLLEVQYYRLAYWKVGAHEVNYRRFFAVDTLVGLKMESPEVFDAAHVLLGDLIATHAISGIRLDHIDGLWNPVEYLNRLEALVRQRRTDGSPLYILVEKILAPGEKLPEPWAVHGTTGYEFCGSLVDLFLDPKDEPEWTRIYHNFTGENATSRDLTYQDKLFVLQEIFPNAVANLAHELDTLIEPDWHWRDLSLHDLETALRYLIACLPVYRTYRMPGEEMSPIEKNWIAHALDEAIRRNPHLDPLALRFVARVLTGDYPPADLTSEQHRTFAEWVCKLQQATGAVMAKSVEDTHFYRYVRMVGGNEVGHHPGHFGAPVAEFHQANLQRQQQVPFCLLATSTHDTKMSEDARARLLALAELPLEWESHLRMWHRLNQSACTEIRDQAAPDAREEYLLYQALLAAWPLGHTSADSTFLDRFKAYFCKALNEAKRNTTWSYPQEDWQAAVDRFIETILVSAEFLTDFTPFAQRIAHRGMLISLTQTVLKLTSPGVPDIYQGNEIWDFSLVDPDNRRPVDFELCATLLSQLDQRTPTDLLENWQDGAIKMHVTRSLLRCRKEFPVLFTAGDYIALTLMGEKADHAMAFLRRHETQELLVIVPRRLGADDGTCTGSFWGDTRLVFTDSRVWKNLLTGKSQPTHGPEIFLSEIFSEWPMAILLSS